ncbi:MAG: M28 family peptidase [Bacteroidia bacterium]|nr:M28 family peptidase [Bacteroidia bacterium]
MKRLNSLFILLLLTVGFIFSVSCNSCQSQKNMGKETVTNTYVKISPDFNADSAYSFVEKQVSFGPRVPGTPAHKACGDYLATKLTGFGATVFEQKANVTHYDGQNIEIRNIIGSYQPEKEKRILLFAHWDSRPFADEELDTEKQNTPIAGADDGASGVGVLLEIARQLQQKTTDVGIDIIFFDLEDWGQAAFDKNYVFGTWWCVGSRYWSENPHIHNYKASYGILLDMVGAANATFLHEGYSMQHASNIVSKIWSTASNLGYGKFFVQQNGSYITDDHVPIIENRKIPCANIINLKDTDNGFAPHWHTHNDDMRNISKETLNAAGQTVMEVIYREIITN